MKGKFLEVRILCANIRGKEVYLKVLEETTRDGWLAFAENLIDSISNGKDEIVVEDTGRPHSFTEAVNGDIHSG